MAILALLAAMVLIGLKGIARSSEEKETRATMENLLAMATEYTLTNSADLNGLGEMREPPGSVQSNEAYQRLSAVAATGYWLNKFQAIPNNRQAMERIPQNKRAKLSAMGPAVGAPVAGDYYFGDRVSDTEDRVVIRQVTNADTQYNPGAEIFSPKHVAIEKDDWPVVLDAWNNPIIMIPGGGMPQAAGSDAMIKAGDGKAFFGSAGPDGNFATLNDNVWSFQ